MMPIDNPGQKSSSGALELKIARSLRLKVRLPRMTFLSI